MRGWVWDSETRPRPAPLPSLFTSENDGFSLHYHLSSDIFKLCVRQHNSYLEFLKRKPVVWQAIDVKAQIKITLVYT